MQKSVVRGRIRVPALVAAIAVSCSFPAFVDAQTSSSSGLRTMDISDPGNNMKAFTVDIPSNWKFTGTILRPGGCHAPALPASGLSYSAVSPDNVTATMQLPGSHWAWASDGTNPEGPKCKPVNISSAAAFLLNIAALNVHPSAKIMGVVPLPAQMQQGLEAARRNLQSNCATPSTLQRYVLNTI